MNQLRHVWHRLTHLLGWNVGTHRFWREGDDLWSCFVCECGEEAHHHRVPDHVYRQIPGVDEEA